ncbi:MAG: hypothetical protein IH940_06750 [Acidobacteria bacterium]|nr:hypothetical protein [Acidobacteriota bacterium]
MHARPTPYVKRHPIRGALFGLGMGLGVAMILVGQAVIAFGTLSPIFVILAGVVIGILYGTLMPPKGPKEPDPADRSDDVAGSTEMHEDGDPDEVGSPATDIADETSRAPERPDG